MALDLEIAAATVFMEARGGGVKLMSAVAAVLQNRLKAGKFGATLAEVCLAPKQFSCWQSPPNLKALALVSDEDQTWQITNAAVTASRTISTPDPTAGACFYYDTSIEAPAWTAEMVETVQIANVKFYRE